MKQTEELKRLQQEQFRKEMSQLSENESSIRQLKNELAMQRLKYEGEVKRLQSVVVSQERALESYRTELENIMNEINLRGK